MTGAAFAAVVLVLMVRDKMWWQLIVAIIVLLALEALPARADALWDFYFGPDAVRCDAIGTTPEEAVAVTHRLQIAGHQEHLRAWFAAHPQYRAEVAAMRAYYEQNCRDTD
jgi:hypothetical protein